MCDSQTVTLCPIGWLAHGTGKTFVWSYAYKYIAKASLKGVAEFFGTTTFSIGGVGEREREKAVSQNSMWIWQKNIVLVC